MDADPMEEEGGDSGDASADSAFESDDAASGAGVDADVGYASDADEPGLCDDEVGGVGLTDDDDDNPAELGAVDKLLELFSQIDGQESEAAAAASTAAEVEGPGGPGVDREGDANAPDDACSSSSSSSSCSSSTGPTSENDVKSEDESQGNFGVDKNGRCNALPAAASGREATAASSSQSEPAASGPAHGPAEPSVPDLGEIIAEIPRRQPGSVPSVPEQPQGPRKQKISEVLLDLPPDFPGRLSYNISSRSFQATCFCEEHKTTLNLKGEPLQCRISRTSNASRWKPQQGRPLGTLVAWLRKASEHPDQPGHIYSIPSPKERRDARTWLMTLPNVESFLSLERPLRPGEADEPASAP
jgi:hypothetical protein